MEEVDNMKYIINISYGQHSAEHEVNIDVMHKGERIAEYHGKSLPDGMREIAHSITVHQANND